MKEEALCGNISSAFSPFSAHGAPAVDGHQCARDLLEQGEGPWTSQLAKQGMGYLNPAWGAVKVH